jgi:hypothetical protein
LPSITGDFVKSVSFTGWAFSGGNKLLGFPTVGLVEEDEAAVASGAADNSGLGDVEGTEGAEVLAADGVASLLSDEVPGGIDWLGCVEDVDWAHARGENRTSMTAASTRRFMVWRVSRVSRNQSFDLH